MLKDFRQLCTPAKVYFAIAVIASIIALVNRFPMMLVIWRLMFAFVWTIVLGYICKKGYKTLAWALVALPYVVLLLEMFRIYNLTEPTRQVMRTVGLQGAYGQEAFGGGPLNVKSIKK